MSFLKVRALNEIKWTKMVVLFEDETSEIHVNVLYCCIDDFDVC